MYASSTRHDRAYNTPAAENLWIRVGRRQQQHSLTTVTPLFSPAESAARADVAWNAPEATLRVSEIANYRQHGRRVSKPTEQIATDGRQHKRGATAATNEARASAFASSFQLSSSDHRRRLQPHLYPIARSVRSDSSP